MRRILLAVAAALLAAVSITGCSSGADSGTLRVGTEGTYSPFSFQGTDGKLTGYDIEVVTAVAGKLGKKVEFVQTPFDAIFAGLEAKRFDLIANQVTINDERKAKYDLSQPYTVSEGVIVTRADDTSITSLADLKGKTTAQSSTSNWAHGRPRRRGERRGRRGLRAGDPAAQGRPRRRDRQRHARRRRLPAREERHLDQGRRRRPGTRASRRSRRSRTAG